MEKKKNIIILTILYLFFSIFFFAKTGNFLIDFSRESYIPYQMICGDKLVKDIFLIYGPFGYILNSFLYFLCPTTNLLLIEAHLISFGILFLFYLILNKFFTEKVSLFFSAIFLAISIFSNSTFSFVLPYSFSTLWAIFGIYLALFSLFYNKKKILFLSLGLILSSKIELFVGAFIISLVYLIYKKEKFYKDIVYFFIFPSLCMFYFLINNISLEDILKNNFYLKEMLRAKSLKYLYEGMGVLFNLKYFIYNLILFLKVFLVFLFSHFLYIIKRPFISYLAIGLLCFLNLNFAFNLAFFISIFITILSLRFKSISKEEILLLAFALLLSIKSAFALNSIGYGNFGYCLIVIYIFLQMQKFVNKKWLINSLILYFIFSFVFNLVLYFSEDKKLVWVKGNILAIKNIDLELFNKTNLFIDKHIKPNEKFIVLPEGQIFNLIHKKTYGLYNSTFTPLDFEIFKDDELISQMKLNKIDYVIFYPRNTKDYGKQEICFDYAVDFCGYIMDNYTQVATLKDNRQVTIFKLKK